MLANPTNRECDRFIPSRNNFRPYHPSSPLGKEQSQTSSVYGDLMRKELCFSTQTSSQEISSFMSIQESYVSCFSQQNEKEFVSKLRPGVESPVKILDVPKYTDDFYFNNIDWSDKGPLGIALQNQVFLYTPDNIAQLKKQTSTGMVSGIKMYDQLMAVGHVNGVIQLYDIEKCSMVRKLLKHQNRVSALMFLDGLLVTGSKDRSIVIHDLRQRDHVVKEFNKHRGQICTLKAKNKTEKVFASGSADGSAIIWDLKFGYIDQLKCHKGAVKALDWCPWKNGILATGGGSQTERSIKLWNTTNSSLIYKQQISSQISSICWNEELNMMVSAHGYNQNSVRFWSLDSTKQGKCKLQSRKEFNIHSGRVLNLEQSHDQHYLCTVGADETLKFWYLMDNAESDPFSNEPKGQKNESMCFRL